ncbi:MAG: PqqD family peptide modification chaperone [Prevotella bivia]|nr:PqqD family peptide modification chaperone [Prevotella bivia]
MKVKSGFNLRNVCGEEIIVAEGEENIDFSNIVSMNESSAALWKEAQQLGTFTVDDLVTFLCSLYDVDEATAKTDVTKTVAQWGVVGIIEGDDIPVSAKEEAAEEKIVVASQQEVETPKKKGFFSRLFGK